PGAPKNQKTPPKSRRSKPSFLNKRTGARRVPCAPTSYEFCGHFNDFNPIIEKRPPFQILTALVFAAPTAKFGRKADGKLSWHVKSYSSLEQDKLHGDLEVHPYEAVDVCLCIRRRSGCACRLGRRRR